MAPLESEYAGLRYRAASDVYAPHDDTFLLVDAVAGVPDLTDQVVVEVGCGAGLGLIAALRRGARGLGVDRNASAVRLARANARLNGVAARAAFARGDLTGAVDLAAVDLLLFNPPYLPTAEHERLPGELNLAFDGGPSGNETILRFAASLVAHHDAGGRVPSVLFVTSSLNDRHRVKRLLAEAGLGVVRGLGTRAFPFERLYAELFTP